MIKRNFNGGGTTWPGSSSSTTNTSASDFYGSGGPHGNQSNQAANVINKPTVYVPTGGSDDYGIGSGGEFGGINYGNALPGGGSQEDSYDWRTDSDYGGSTYVPTFGNTIEDFTSAYGGLSYDWVDPNSDFLNSTIKVIHYRTMENIGMRVEDYGILFTLVNILRAIKKKDNPSG